MQNVVGSMDYDSEHWAIPRGGDRSSEFFSLTQLLQEITRSAGRCTDLEEIVERIGGWLEKLLGSVGTGAFGSIWLANFVPEPGDGPAPSLFFKRAIGKGEYEPDERSCGFGHGVIGRAASTRSIINEVLANSETDSHPEGGHITSWGPGHTTRAILAVPMVYQERLVGVLSVNRPEPRVFSTGVELSARILAFISAQTIHQQQLDHLFARIVGEGEGGCTQLAETVARVVGNFIESPYACVYVWDVLAKCLRLKATSQVILSRAGRELSLDEECYQTPGVGLTRWVFDQQMWLNIEDLEALDDPNKEGYEAQKKAVLDQILSQNYTAEEIADVRLEESSGSPGTPLGDERRFWRVEVPGQPACFVLQPHWSRQYRFRGSRARSLVAVPILDPWQGGSALGVMLFARPEVAPFNSADVTLLQGIARHVARTVFRQQEVQAQELERRFVAQVVTMEPTSWKTEFQHRLEQQLRAMREVIGVDLLLIRVKDGDELTFAASDPTQESLRDTWGVPDMVIPGVTYLGVGASGRAAASKRSVYVPSPDHPYRQEVLTDLGPRYTAGEAAFALKIGSEVAVPLMVGETVVGTITAICADPSSLAARFIDDRWVSELKGVQEQTSHFLQYHAHWLGPALQTIRVMVLRSRQISSLSLAIQQLSSIVNDRKASPKLFRSVALVIATHHEGLGFHQAFIARCESDSPFPGTQTIRNAAGDAWGCLNFQEQDHARRNRAELEADIKGALADPDVCNGIRGAWKEFRVEVPYQLEGPCVIVRQVGPPRSHSSQMLVLYHIAEPGDPWSRLLDAFCQVFGIERNSETGQRIQVGMVKLGRNANGVPRSLVFVTNVGFSPDGRVYVEPIALEPVAALHDLGSLLTLAEGVSDRVRMNKQIRAIRRKLNELDFDRGPRQ